MGRRHLRKTDRSAPVKTGAAGAPAAAGERESDVNGAPMTQKKEPVVKTTNGASSGAAAEPKEPGKMPSGILPGILIRRPQQEDQPDLEHREQVGQEFGGPRTEDSHEMHPGNSTTTSANDPVPN